RPTRAVAAQSARYRSPPAPREINRGIIRLPSRARPPGGGGRGPARRGGPAPPQHPRVLLQVPQGAQDPLADRQLRPPAEGAHLAGVQEDEGAVADPAALAAGVAAPRGDPQLSADPAERVVHRAVLLGAQVEDVHRLPRPVDDAQHGVEAVLHVQVRLALPAVAEHLDLVRVLQELAVEVVDVAVRVALAEDRDEAEDVALE